MNDFRATECLKVYNVRYNAWHGAFVFDRHVYNSTGDPVKLYVGNLPFSATENDIASLFEKAGKVVSVRAVMDRETGRFKGFCFVEMESKEAADEAIKMFNGSELNNRPMVVNPARPPEPRNTRGGFGGGHRGERQGRPPRY
jgi:RNA recognition motif-containing protein